MNIYPCGPINPLCTSSPTPRHSLTLLRNLNPPGTPPYWLSDLMISWLNLSKTDHLQMWRRHCGVESFIYSYQ